MLAIILLAFGAACGAGILLLAGIPLVALRFFRLLPLDRRLWWLFAAVVAYVVVRDMINSTYDYSPPTNSPDKGYYQIHMMGAQMGVIGAFLIGLAILFPLGGRNMEKPIHMRIAIPAAMVVLGCGVALIANGSIPIEQKRAKYETHRTQLAEALRQGDATSLKKLLKAGAKIDAPFKELDNQWALDYAIAQQHVDVVACLLDPPRGRRPKVSDRMFQTVLHTKNHKLIDVFLKRDRSRRLGAGLRAAITIDDQEMIDFFFKQGADPNACDGFDTPLTICAKGDRRELALALIRRGADVNAYHGSPDLNRGSTPLITAVDHGHIEMVKLLIDHGADINRTARSQRSALQAACRAGHVEIASLLIEHGCDLNYQSAGRDYTALHWTLHSKSIDDTRKSEVVGMLIRAGANQNLPDSNGMTAKKFVELRNAIRFAELQKQG